MGHTVTFCRMRRPNLAGNLTRDALRRHRQELTEILKTYLESPLCVNGVMTQIEGTNPYADALARYYMTFLTSEIVGHGGDKLESIASMAGLGLVFSEMWAQASDVLYGNSEIKNHLLLTGKISIRQREPLFEIDRLAANADVDTLPADIPAGLAPEYRLGFFLSRAYCKALVELQYCSIDEDCAMIKHHASLLGDLMDEMLDLVQYLSPDNRESEYALPSSHPHSLVLTDQAI